MSTFAHWAIVELMGHRRLAGYVEEVELFGGKMMRLDIPSEPPVTQFYGPSAIYAVTPTTEEVARAFARDRQPRPVPLRARTPFAVAPELDRRGAERRPGRRRRLGSGGAVTTARELAWDLRHEDPAEVYLEQASTYLEIACQAERRALYHAEQGDVLVAYDEAMDARWGLGMGAVFVVAWLASIAGREAHRRALTLDCSSTAGEQLALAGACVCAEIDPSDRPCLVCDVDFDEVRRG